ncbi:MAG: hypothetical protein DLM69_05855 [Candidatus Chloroheliales bacterium]|nr:MAG: hypothetical protein DLM69_05855 [Chloroflexota bacterium]
MKALITTASLAATVSGWAMLSAQNINTDQSLATQAVVAAPAADSSFSLPVLQLNPLPTLEPAEDFLGSSGQTTIQPQSAPPVNQPPPTATTLPQVSPPAPSSVRPQPVTTTRSSR